MAVVAVIITAPLGAILTNTLGVIWLNDDSEEVPETQEIATEITKSFKNKVQPEELVLNRLQRTEERNSLVQDENGEGGNVETPNKYKSNQILPINSMDL
jgi:hypothetical protein